VIASASGSGKTTVGRELAARLSVPFVELDHLVHGPGWAEVSDHDLHAQLAPILTADGWVIDGSYTRKLGRRVIDVADTVVWLDLPIGVWLPRLVRRGYRRLRGLEPLWNGNRESVRGLIGGRSSLFGYALQTHVRRRRHWPELLAGKHVVRLRTPAEVADFLQRAG
jgi:adenylate kinase family enzyme